MGQASSPPVSHARGGASDRRVPGFAPLSNGLRSSGRRLPLPTRRALVAAAIPAIVVFGVFWRWLGFSLPLAAVLGVAWCLASLIVTRSVYDDAEAELAAWRAAAPDLAGSGVPGPARPSAGATPGETSGETPA